MRHTSGPHRYLVLGLLCTLSMLTYLDRVCFGTAAPTIASELGLNGVADLKWAFTAFTIAYALFEIPAGWMGDRWGPRLTLVRIVLWWSLCTALTGLVGLPIGGMVLGGFGTLVSLRFLFGAGEAGAYPNITRAIHNWFPVSQWEFAQGCIWMSGRLMGGLTPLVWSLLVAGTATTTPLVTWRGAFLLFAGLGIFWCGMFLWIFRDRPTPLAPAKESAAPNGNSEKRVRPVAWTRLLTSRSLWALCLMYFLLNYGWAFNITYLPGYLEQRFGISQQDPMGALAKGAPLWVGAAGCLLGGLGVSWLDRLLGNRRLARQTLGTVAMLGCSACWWGALSATNFLAFCVFVSAAAFLIDLSLGAAWASCQDIGQDDAAVTAAIMNTIGTFGAALANWLTGTIVQASVSAHAISVGSTISDLSETAHTAAELLGYQSVFTTSAVVYIIAAIGWSLVFPWRRPQSPAQV